MKNIAKYLTSARCLGLMLATLMAASTAFADDSNSWMDDGGIGIPPYEYTGWFFNPTVDLFPNLDPSQPWTSQANIDQINYWLQIVADMDGDPSLANLGAWSDPNALALAIETAQSQSTVPEPVSTTLLCSGLALVVLNAYRRRRILASRTM